MLAYGGDLLERQTPSDMLWIHPMVFSTAGSHSNCQATVVVVHGHTICDLPRRTRAHRIDIDAGTSAAVSTGASGSERGKTCTTDDFGSARGALS